MSSYINESIKSRTVPFFEESNGDREGQLNEPRTASGARKVGEKRKKVPRRSLDVERKYKKNRWQLADVAFYRKFVNIYLGSKGMGNGGFCQFFGCHISWLI